MYRTAITVAVVALLSGCANFQAPKFVDTGTGCTPDSATSLCLLNTLSENYKTYSNSAQKSRMISDTTALGAAGGAIIGAATNAHSDLYKAAGGIALTAMGLSKYANFKTQALASRVAASKLTCAKAPLTDLLNRAGFVADADLTKRVAVLRSEFSLPGLDMRLISGQSVIEVFTTPTTIQQTDFLALSNVVTTYEAAQSNVDRAARILEHIDEEATMNLVGLQLTTINEIENDAFKLDEAMKVLRPDPPAKVTPSTDTRAAFDVSAPKVLSTNEEAVKVIESYDSYTRCMRGDFTPTTF